MNGGGVGPMGEPGPELLAALAAILKERVGLHVKPEAYGSVRSAVLARFGASRPPPVPMARYLDHLASPGGDEELRRLLPLVTVGKTDFFRDERQFAALAAVLPGMLERARAAGRPVAIWSAGCATGEEPYTIAMVAAEAGAQPGEIDLLATDVNPDAVAFAAAGCYQPRRVAAIPPPLLERYFEPVGPGNGAAPAAGGCWRAGARLRALIRGFEAHNLVTPAYPRPAAGSWDVIFCRNVIIYFDTVTTQGVLGGFYAGLAPGGWLFLGYSESLFRMFDGFELTELAGAFIYRRPDLGAASGPLLFPPVVNQRYTPSAVRSSSPAHAVDAAPRLTPAPSPGRPAGRGPAPRTFSTQELLDAVVQLCGAGRFTAALERLEQRVADGPEDLAVRLTLGNLLGVLQRPDEAAACYQAALQLEPLSAEAHLLFGIHLLGQGSADEAAQEIARALFLDPDSAIGHYFLGRCREAQRDLARARLSYRNAIAACDRRPAGRSQPFVGFYPDLPEDGAPFARAATYALQLL